MLSDPLRALRSRRSTTFFLLIPLSGILTPLFSSLYGGIVMSKHDVERARSQISNLLSQGKRDALRLSDFSAGLAVGLIYGIADTCPAVRNQALAAVATIRDTCDNRWRVISGGRWKRPKYHDYPRAYPKAAQAAGHV